MTDPDATPDTPEDDDITDAFDLGIDVDEFADDTEPAPEAEPTPAAEAVGFFDAGPDAALLDDLRLADRVPVLERLGPAHFRSKGFSFMGFLQTVYEHVAAEAKGERPTEESA